MLNKNKLPSLYYILVIGSDNVYFYTHTHTHAHTHAHTHTHTHTDREKLRQVLYSLLTTSKMILAHMVEALINCKGINIIAYLPDIL